MIIIDHYHHRNHTDQEYICCRNNGTVLPVWKCTGLYNVKKKMWTCRSTMMFSVHELIILFCHTLNFLSIQIALSHSLSLCYTRMHRICNTGTKLYSPLAASHTCLTGYLTAFFLPCHLCNTSREKQLYSDLPLKWQWDIFLTLHHPAVKCVWQLPFCSTFTVTLLDTT